MRRCLHSLLVGVLTFSLTIDAARACGHLRHVRWCAPVCRGPVVIVPATVVWDACGAVPMGCPLPVADGCGCGDVAITTFLVGCPTGCEEIACGTPLDCCGSTVTAPTAPAAGVVDARPTPATGVPAPQTPTPAEAAPAAAAAAARAPEPLATVPDLAPVAPASAIEPELELPEEESPEAAATEDDLAAEEPMEEAAEPEAPEAEPEMEAPVPAEDEPVVQPEPAPQPEPEPTPEPQPEPQRRNPFEEVDEEEAEAGPGLVDPAAPGAEPADVDPLGAGPDAADAPPAEPVSEDVVPVDDPPMEEEAATDAVPAVEPPVDEAPPFDAPEADPSDEPSPATEPAEPTAAAEPLRRWIDETGSFAVVGRLTDVRGDAVEILKADGRSVTVPLALLSGFDRDYVAAAGPRVAAVRQPAPRPTDTAGR